MVSSTLRRNVVFVAGWVLAGLAIALLVNHFSPQSRAVPKPLAASPADAAPHAMSATQDISKAGAVVARGTPAPSEPATVTTGVNELPAPVSSYAAAVRASAPAVVSVYTETTVGRTRDPRGEAVDLVKPGLGSGVIVDAQGHIITNDHVLNLTIQKNTVQVDEIYVQLADGRSGPATVVGKDPETDLAVLKIDLPRLPVMPMGRSDRLAVGDVVLAIGNPYGLSQTVTQGIVSAVDRTLNGGVAHFENFIQTDAAINHGNSGGALVNARGELIGINTAVIGNDTEQRAFGLGLAIPVDLARGVLSEIVRNGRVTRGWIGIGLPQNVTEQQVRELAVSRIVQLPHAGVIVNEVIPNSPAAQAGLMRFDMIESVDGEPVYARGAQVAHSRISSHKPGTSVKLTVTRNRQRLDFDVKVIEQPSSGP